MRRFFIDGDIHGQIQINKDDEKHIKNVLRMKVGETLILVDNKGESAFCEIVSFSDGLSVVVKEFLQEQNETALHVILGQGLGKGDKMDFVVQKAVELGAKEIVPLALEHCVPSYVNDKAKGKSERWRKIAREAAKQCQRNIVPKVHEVMSLAEALNSFSPDAGIVFYEQEQANGLRSVLAEHKHAKTIFLLIGPEGGLSEKEVDLCQKAGFISASLGKRILRTETAAVAALSVVMYELGDFGNA